MKTSVNLSNRLVSKLNVSPAQFKQLLLSKQAATTVATKSGVSARTVQEYRKVIRDNGLYVFSTTVQDTPFSTY